MKNENVEWIDPLRVFATFSVIVLLVASVILHQYGKVPDLDWWTGNIYDSSVRFCVPIFLMISGTLILSKTYDNLIVYLKKRVLRIFFPFLFWSLIYIAKDLIPQIMSSENIGFIDVLSFIFNRLKVGSSVHFWYIYMIIGIYLFFPILSKWLRKSDDLEIKYFLTIWFISIIAHLPFFEHFFPNVELSYFSGYLGFPVLGYYLNKKSFYFGEKKSYCISGILIGILITLVGTFYFTKYNGTFYDGFYNYLSLNVIIVSSGIFLFFKNFVRINSRPIKFFSRYSYGVYLVHILVLLSLGKLGLTYNFIHPIIGIPLTSIVCFITSTLIVTVLNKMPFGKYVAG